MAKRSLPTDLIELPEVLEITGLSESGFRYLRTQHTAPRGYKRGRRLYFSRARIVDWNDRRMVAA